MEYLGLAISAVAVLGASAVLRLTWRLARKRDDLVVRQARKDFERRAWYEDADYAALERQGVLRVELSGDCPVLVQCFPGWPELRSTEELLLDDVPFAESRVGREALKRMRAGVGDRVRGAEGNDGLGTHNLR